MRGPAAAPARSSPSSASRARRSHPRGDRRGHVLLRQPLVLPRRALVESFRTLRGELGEPRTALQLRPWEPGEAPVREPHDEGADRAAFRAEIENVRAFLPGSLVDVRPIRDDIEQRVRVLMDELGIEPLPGR